MDFPPVRSILLHFLRYHVATCFGLGFSPYAPGVLSALAAVVLVYLLMPAGFVPQLLLTLLLPLGAVHVCEWMQEAEGVRHPPHVVIDEAVGQAMVFLWLPIMYVHSWRTLLLGFVLFRLLIMWKPWPIRRFTELPGGWGMVLDDVAAALAANLLLHIQVSF